MLALLCVSTFLVSTHCDIDDGPPVDTQCARFIGVRSHVAGVWAFRGIKYAEDPKRFQPPVPKKCSPGKKPIVDASACGDVCFQKNSLHDQLERVLALFFGLIALAACCSVVAWICLNVSSKIRPEGAEPLIAPTKKTSCCCGRRCHGCLCCGAAVILSICAAAVAVPIFFTNQLRPTVGSEDCLTLNVFTPMSPNESFIGHKKLPVMMFIHGGSSVSGTGCDYGTSSGGLVMNYGTISEVSATGRVVSVTTNYRLNIFGFLYLEGNNTTVNAGILDILESLRWVKRNIIAFGGDPREVTIYGQSSGGTLILALLACPAAKDLFKRAFTTSASAKIVATKHEASESWQRFFVHNFVHNFQCKNATLSQCLQLSSPEDLFKAIDPNGLEPPGTFNLPNGSHADQILLEVVDGDTLIGKPHEVVAQGNMRLPAVPMLMGATREEVNIMFVKNTFWPMSRSTARKWATEIVHSAQFGDDVWELFKPSNTTPAQQRWEQLASDFIVVCPNLFFAHQIASAPGRIEPVYTFVMSYLPTNTHLLLGLVPTGWKHAFHTWDTELLFHCAFFGGTYVQYTFSAADDVFADRYRNTVLEFATTGRISNWSKMPFMGAPVTCDLGGKKYVCSANLDVLKQCKLLKEYGLDFNYSTMN